MHIVLDFLSQNPIFAVFLCLAVGYLIGLIKIKSFAFGATIGTLLVGFVLSRFAHFEIPGILPTVFSLFFCFTVGYEAGPAFFSNLKSNGLKFVLQALFFSLASFGILWLVGFSGILGRDTVIGLAAGALTQTSILTVAEGLGDGASIAYAVTYMTGTLFAILFASVIGPLLLRTSPIRAAKQKLDRSAPLSRTPSEENVRLSPIHPRAFVVKAGAACIGKTVEELEDRFSHTLEVVKLFRNGASAALDPNQRILENDVLTVISPTKQLIQLDDEFMAETGESKYLSIEVATREIIVTEPLKDSLVDLLSVHGIVLRSVTLKNQKKAPITDTLTPAAGMLLKVSGSEVSIRKAAEMLGYVKEIGTVTDVPLVFGALAAAVLFGTLKLFGFGLGDSTFALILGLVCGWFCNKKPKYGKFPEGARWLLKSVGLNVFIAAKALSTGSFRPDLQMLLILGVGIGVTLLVHALTLLFAKLLLRMEDADVLGGQCGSGTCSAALNSLIDSAGSSVFTAAYATTNAVANVLLTVVGVLLSSLL